jgi:hypothetical protein
MSTARKRTSIALAAAFLIGVGGVYAIVARSPTDAEIVQKLGTVMAAMKTQKIVAYRDQDWCRNLSSATGSYSTNTSTATCDLFPDAATPFDAHGNELFAMVHEAVRHANLDVDFINVDYRDGEITNAEIALSGRTGSESYVYTHDAGRLADRSEVKALASGWYYVIEHR